MDNRIYLQHLLSDLYYSHSYIMDLRVLDELNESPFPNRKANIITNCISSFCYISDDILYIKTINATRIFKGNIKDYVYYITTNFLESNLYILKQSLQNFSFSTYTDILRKSNIEEYLPNIVGQLQCIIPSPIRIPVVVFDEEHARECPICLESKTRFNQTRCNHLFCTGCFINIQNHSCPLCRANIST